MDITLTGTGALVAVPEIAIEQLVGTNLVNGVSVTDFGVVNIGSDASLHHRHRGTANLIILGFSIDGPDSDRFSLTSIPAAPVAPPRRQHAPTVRFTPDTVDLKTATVHVQSNNSDENPFDLTLTGTGAGSSLRRRNGEKSIVFQAEVGGIIIGFNAIIVLPYPFYAGCDVFA